MNEIEHKILVAKGIVEEEVKEKSKKDKKKDSAEVGTAQ
jgi:hypothetical protein